MHCNKWDVIFVSFPNQEDKSKSTKRPALVLDINSTIASICPITKNLNQASRYTDTIRINKDSPENKLMRLNFDSLIVLDKNRIEEINISRIDFKFGSCPNNIRTQIGSILAKKK